MRFFLRNVIIFLALLFPFSCLAFSVSPAVVDVAFPIDGSVVTQVFSLTNTQEVAQTYVAKVQEVTFTADGSIAGFSDVSSDIGAVVDPSQVTVLSGGTQTFTVTFTHSDVVTSAQIFALFLTEKGGDHQEVSDAFAALLFPQGIASSSLPSLRIDAFTFIDDGGDIRAVAQLTNTSDVLVRPASMLIGQDRFGKEIGRWVFAPDAGRLPVGTTRVVSDILPLTSLGFWHVGGDVTFTLLSIPDTGGDVQRASITFFTYPGIGIWIVGGAVLLFGVGIVVFFFKKRGILRS